MIITGLYQFLLQSPEVGYEEKGNDSQLWPSTGRSPNQFVGGSKTREFGWTTTHFTTNVCKALLAYDPIFWKLFLRDCKSSSKIMCIHIRLRSIFQEFQLVHCHYWKAPHIAMRLTPWPGANGQIHSGRCTNRAVVQCFQNTEHCNPKRYKMRELSVHVSTVYYVNRIIYLENMQNSLDTDVLERAVAAVWGSKAGPASNPRNLTACPLKFAHGVNDVCFCVLHFPAWTDGSIHSTLNIKMQKLKAISKLGHRED